MISLLTFFILNRVHQWFVASSSLKAASKKCFLLIPPVESFNFQIWTGCIIFSRIMVHLKMGYLIHSAIKFEILNVWSSLQLSKKMEHWSFLQLSLILFAFKLENGIFYPLCCSARFAQCHCDLSLGSHLKATRKRHLYDKCCV